MSKVLTNKFFWGFVFAFLVFSAGYYVRGIVSDPGKVYVTIPETSIKTIIGEIEATRKILRGIEFPKSYTIFVPGDSFYIDSSTPYGEIPVVETSWPESANFFVNKTPVPLKMEISVVHRGDIFEHELRLTPSKTEIKTGGKSDWRPFGYIGGGCFTPDYTVPIMTGVGLKYKKVAFTPTYMRFKNEDYWGAMMFVIF